ncbi:MAG: hypothetical protein KKB25_03615 [Nanoarchaeota archaeon]|nr:hypothetical protein [Nanoarchaeota archaeon]
MVNPIVIFDCAFFRVGFMIIEDKTKGNAESKAYFFELEKRLVNLEASARNIGAGMQRGNLNPEQEQRVVAVEERLENMEDLQMVANIDIIKMKEILEKVTPAGEFAPSAVGYDEFSRKKIGEIEDSLNSLGRKVDSIESPKISGKGGAGAGEEIRRMKEDLESFKKDTEESVKIIASSIKKLAEIINRRA